MPAPDLAQRVDGLVGQALQHAGFSGQGTALVVAVSGGPDSTALLRSLHRLAGDHRLDLHVAHIIHDLRGLESEEDAQFVADLAAQLDLPITVERRDPSAYQRQRRISSLEQATRELRYSFLSAVARRQSAQAVAVGHTSDDQAETVLLHLLRGSGLHGLRGMTEISPWPWPSENPDLRLFRPLLQIARAETADYCRALGQPFRTDSENDQPYFARNRVRNQLIPLLEREFNPRVKDALVRLSHTAALDLDYLERECDRLWPPLTADSIPSGAVSGADAIQLDLAVLATAHPALQRLALRRAYATLAGDARRLQEDHLTAMTSAINATPGFAMSLPRGIWLHRVYSTLTLSRNSEPPCPLPRIPGQHLLNLPAAGYCARAIIGGWDVSAQLAPTPADFPADSGPGTTVAYLNPDALPGPLTVRTRQPGDKFQPLGMTRAKKLQDFFVDEKIPRYWRERVPLLVSDRGIAWVVGHRIAEWAKLELNPSTPNSNTLRVEFTPTAQKTA